MYMTSLKPLITQNMGENSTMSNLYVYLIRSRNKDNKNIPNFKQRVKTILEKIRLAIPLALADG